MGIKDFLGRYFVSRYTQDEGETFNLSESIEQIKTNTFNGYKNVKKITGPNVKSIDDYAFKNFGELAVVDFQNLTSIGKGTFEKCGNLEIVDIPKIQNVGEGAFKKCEKINMIFIEKEENCRAVWDNLSETAKEKANICIGEGGINGKWFYFVQKYVDGTLYLTEDIEIIKEGMLDYYKNELKMVVGTSVVKIESNAFKNYAELVDVRFPNVQEIGDNAFENCENLRGMQEIIVFPKATKIGNEAFINCTNLEQLQIQEAETIGDKAFEGCDKLSDLIVKNTEVCLTMYDKFSEYLKMKVRNKQFKIALDKEQTLFNDYDFDKSEESLDKYMLCSDPTLGTKYASLPETFTEIKSNMMNKYRGELTMISCKGTVRIDEGAFKECKKLFHAHFPSAIFICDEAFNGCEGLIRLTLGDVEIMGENVFAGCEKLEKITIANEEKYDLVVKGLPENLKNKVRIFVGNEEILKNADVGQENNAGW